jgi:hypothetical protein
MCPKVKAWRPSLARVVGLVCFPSRSLIPIFAQGDTHRFADWAIWCPVAPLALGVGFALPQDQVDQPGDPDGGHEARRSVFSLVQAQGDLLLNPAG